MPNWMGSITSNSTSNVYDVTMEIRLFSVTNKTGGSVNITVGIKYGSTFDIIYNKPLAASGSTGCEYIYPGWPILLPPNNQIFISVSGACDFYFSIYPVK